MTLFLRRTVWPVFAGLLVAFIIMMLFEFTNSYFYPLPEGLDIYDSNAVKAFTATLPWTAYILVIIGWILGSFKAGCVTTYLAKETTYRLTAVVGGLLTLMGVLNNVMLGHSLLFNIVTIPLFFVGTYYGHVSMRRQHP
jgi:hypothetical protein